MESVKQWVMTLCLACITAGILQMLTERKKSVSGIKIVLALYILVTAISPLTGLSVSWEIGDVKTASTETEFNTQQEILQSAQQTLSSQIQQELEAQGIDANVEVLLTCTGNEDVQVQEIKICTSVSEERVRAEVQSILGTEANITVES